MDIKTSKLEFGKTYSVSINIRDEYKDTYDVDYIQLLDKEGNQVGESIQNGGTFEMTKEIYSIKVFFVNGRSLDVIGDPDDSPFADENPVEINEQ